MDRAMKRRQILKTKATEMEVTEEMDKSAEPQQHAPQAVLSAEERLVNPNEILTSQAITFRDPETGAILIQTQLLQVIIEFIGKSYFILKCVSLFRMIHQIRMFTLRMITRQVWFILIMHLWMVLTWPAF
jgi:hypothetical protein